MLLVSPQASISFGTADEKTYQLPNRAPEAFEGGGVLFERQQVTVHPLDVDICHTAFNGGVDLDDSALAEFSHCTRVWF